MKGIGALKANAKSLGIDPAHVALWGAGAGANLVLDAAVAAPLVQPASAVQAVVSYSGDTDAFTAMGEYQVAGTSEADVNWAEYIGCANPVVTAWDPTANSCYGLYQGASPALLLDPLGGTFPAGPGFLFVNSTDYSNSAACETTSPRQAAEMQFRANVLGLSTTSLTPSDCAHGFGLLSSELTPTLSFLQAKLG
jgi:acetyl esterase/lipase